jgi:hypothetical protein
VIVSRHVFVDETKERGYFLAVAALPSGDLAAARRAIRRLILPRQRRLHFKHESDARRGEIVRAVLGLGVRSSSTTAPGRSVRRLPGSPA